VRIDDEDASQSERQKTSTIFDFQFKQHNNTKFRNEQDLSLIMTAFFQDAEAQIVYTLVESRQQNQRSHQTPTHQGLRLVGLGRG
jgi:hypothetical protein